MQENPGKTCREILLKNPDCYGQSGNYWINCGNQADEPVEVYCEMERLRGGWQQLLRENFTDGAGCPGQWTSFDGYNGVRYCSTTDGNYKAKFNVFSACPYSEVNGYVLVDQKGNCNAFTGQSKDLWEDYMDGVSITYGSNPKKHLYTYAVGWEEKARLESCECHGSTYTDYATVVGLDYMCDSGMQPNTVGQNLLIGERVLFTGMGCRAESGCCHVAGAPWFYKSLPNTIHDRVELRILSNSPHEEEMVLVRAIELYAR